MWKRLQRFCLQYNKQSVEEILIQTPLKTTIQKLYDNSLFDIYANADKVLKDFLITPSRGPDLEKINDDVVQGFCSKI